MFEYLGEGDCGIYVENLKLEYLLQRLSFLLFKMQIYFIIYFQLIFYRKFIWYF